MSTKKERTKIVGLYQQATVLDKGKRNRFNAGYVWGLHQALLELGFDVMQLHDLYTAAKDWARKFCPSHDDCKAGCSLCGEQFMK